MITAAAEGWRAIYLLDGQSEVVITRMIAVWIYYPELDDDPDVEAFTGMVVDDNGRLREAESIERFVCYCAPDDNPLEILKRRSASE